VPTLLIYDRRVAKPRRSTSYPLALLSDASLRARAGEKTFQRALDYVANGRVALLAQLNGSAEFVVEGTEPYRTTLLIEARRISAECNCPAADMMEFCKHAVAAALYFRSRLGGDPPPAPPRSARAEGAAEARVATRERLQTFLAAQSVDDLAARLWTAAERDKSLMAELKTWEATTRASDDPKALKHLVSEIVGDSQSRFLHGRDVATWALRAEKVVPLLRRALERWPDVARDATEHALRAVYRVAQHMDDSNGEVGAVMESLFDVLVDTLKAAPFAKSWAPRMLALIEDDPYGLIDAASLLATVDAEFARAFTGLVEKRWDELERRKQTEETRHERLFLRGLVLVCLEHAGDSAAVFAFLKRTADDIFGAADLIRWCDQRGRHREAIQFAQAACRKHRNHRLVEDLLLTAYERDGWDEEALAIHKRRFADAPNAHGYAALVKAAARVPTEADAIRPWAYTVLEKRESGRARDLDGRRAERRGRDVTLAVEMLLHDEKLDEALTLVRHPNHCASSVVMCVVERLPPERNAEAFELLDRVLEEEMRFAQSPYHEALHIVHVALARASAADASAYCARLKVKYKAKRNFVSALPAA